MDRLGMCWSPEQTADHPAAMDLKPDALKSGTEQVKDQAKLAGDALGSMVPGQGKARDHFTDNAATPSLTHDHGRAGVTESLKPAGAQSTGEAVQQKLDQYVVVTPKMGRANGQSRFVPPA